MRKILLLTAFVLGSVGVWAQGVTTAVLSGSVVDQKGASLPGATIVAVHVPSGTQYGTASRGDGKFAIPNARVGGPYKLTISFVGYEESVKENVFLSLGNTTNVNVVLAETGTQLQEVQIVAARSDVFNPERTGASVNVDNTTMMSVPTISRGLRDFTRLSPLANTLGSGTSFAGANNRYNQFAIDGLVNNDVFGLSSSGTNGGQTGIEPISLDAIEQFQINIAPYDVRQGGFTGGGINAVTRSGTNTFQGSVYYFGNNESLVGKVNPNTGAEAKYPEYVDYQAGFRVGGPIIKDKVFFFVNGEIARKKTPLAFAPGTPESNITIAEMNSVLSTLQAIAPNYDPGVYDNIENETNSNKWLVKLDWNISKNHKLTARHSYTFGENIDNTRSPNAARFYNAGQYFPSTTNSTGIELNSTFGSRFANRFLLGYTRVRDDRDPLGNPFPWTVVNLDTSTGRSITFGSENSSVANQLDQDNFTLTNDFTMYNGKHTITIGTHNEFYKFYNIFVQNIYGSYAFNTLADFQSQALAVKLAPTFYGIGYSFDPSDDPSQANGAADFSAFQLGIYGQDEFQVSDKLKVIGGLRIDLPIFNDTPAANAAFNTTYGAEGKTGELPKTTPLWAPRLGFNWDVMGDQSLQVRGGTGLFTGRVPFVWVSNQFTNNGEVNGTYTVGNAGQNQNRLTNGITYVVDPYNQPLPGEAPIASVTPGRGAINIIDPDFKFPQVFRTNLAADKKLPWGLTGTVEAIFSKTLNNINFINLQRQEQTNFAFAGADGRPRYTTSSTVPTASGYNSAGRLDPAYDEIVKLENTNDGYSYNFIFQLQKQFENGFTGSVSYTYGDSWDVVGGTSSVAYSNWRNTLNVNGLNNLSTTRADFSTGSRIVGLLSYKKEYLNNMMSTQVSLFYNGQSGQTFSYRYNGDLNYDGTANDLLYVPKDQSEINLVNVVVNGVTITPAEQWAALDKYISEDEYLSERRGQYAERNGARMPFQHNFDLRILQEFAVKVGSSTNKIQLSFDILNVGNMLKDTWGRVYTMSFQSFGLVNYLGLTDTAPGAAVDYSSNTPRFTYTGAGQTNGNPYANSDLLSRWRAQFGIRYIFN